VVLEAGVERKLRAALIFVVKQRRQGMCTFQSSLQPVCQMLVELHPGRNVYENIFETEFLNKTREYYTVMNGLKLAEFG
jgi:Cullin family